MYGPARKLVMMREIGAIAVELWILNGTYEVKTVRWGVRYKQSAYPKLWEEAKAEFNDTVRQHAAEMAATVLGCG